MSSSHLHRKHKLQLQTSITGQNSEHDLQLVSIVKRKKHEISGS